MLLYRGMPPTKGRESFAGLALFADDILYPDLSLCEFCAQECNHDADCAGVCSNRFYQNNKVHYHVDPAVYTDKAACVRGRNDGVGAKHQWFGGTCARWGATGPKRCCPGRHQFLVNIRGAEDIGSAGLLGYNDDAQHNEHWGTRGWSTEHGMRWARLARGEKYTGSAEYGHWGNDYPGRGGGPVCLGLPEGAACVSGGSSFQCTTEKARLCTPVLILLVAAAAQSTEGASGEGVVGSLTIGVPNAFCC